MKRKQESNSDRSWKQVKEAPSGVSIKRNDDFMRIKIRRKSNPIYLIIIGGLIVCFFVFSGESLLAGPSPAQGMLLAILLLTLATLLISRYMSETIELDRKHLQTSLFVTRLLPRLNPLVFDISGFSQLYVEKVEGRSGGVDSVPTYEYGLCGWNSRTSKSISLLRIRQVEIAWYLEQEIEDFLGIKDRAVKGEHVPRRGFGK